MMDALASPSATPYSLQQQQQQPAQSESYCGGCKQPIESETGGVVVSFGEALWHVKCFRCAKCHERVTADTNLLLLSDGSPVCGSCSYNCNVCKLPILDEAIMTGDESYHAACFTCRSCSRQIQELVFAKTSNGIYCMACHNERVARSRRHAEQKRNKSKSAAARKEREKEKEKERERRKDVPATPSRPGLSPNPSAPSPSHSNSIMNSPSPMDTPNSASPGASIQNAHTSFPFPAKRMSTQSIHRVLEEAVPPMPSMNGMTVSNSMPASSNPNRHATPPPSRPSTSMDQNNAEISNAQSSQRTRVDTLPIPGAAESEALLDDERRRKSYDDGVRPLSYFLTPKSATTPKAPLNGLGVGGAEIGGQPTTSRKDKRRSINPGLFLDSSSITSISDGPLSSSPPTGSRGSLDKYAVANGRLSPNPSSPLRASHHEEGDSGRDTMYFSPNASPIPGLESNGRTSRSPSPQPASVSASAPNLAVVGRSTPPPSLSVIQPSPGPVQRLQGGQLPPRMNSLPNGNLATQTQQQQQRTGRSPSPAPARNGYQYTTQERRDSPSPSFRGRKSSSPYELSDGAETDGDVVVVPRENGRRSLGDRPPMVPPKDVAASIPTDVNDGDSDDSDSDGDSPSPPEKESSTPLLAPSLPAMRFSKSDTSFADLLNSVADPSIKITTAETDDEADGRNFEEESVISYSPSVGDEEGDITVVIAPPNAPPQIAAVDDRASPVPSTPTSAQTVRDDQPTLAVDIPTSSTVGDAPPTPPPSSAKSSSSMTSFPTMSTIANGRGVAVPMTLHQSAVLAATDHRQRADSNATTRSIPTASMSLPTISVSTTNNQNGPSRPSIGRNDSSSTDLVTRRLKEALKDTSERGSNTVKLDREFVEAIVRALDTSRDKTTELKGQIDTIKRTSQQVMTGFSVAQSEYHKEIAGRRDAEAEVSRLRVQLSGQAARLTAMSAEHRRQEMMEQMSRDLNINLGVLEKDLSKLKVERDLTLAEVEELGNNDPKSPVQPDGGATMTRSLTARFDNIKTQYRKDLEPLKQNREALIREINELKEARDIFLEETTALNARNEELANLNSQIARQIEIAVSDTGATSSDMHPGSNEAASPISSNESGRPSKGGLFGGGGASSSSKSRSYNSSNGGPSNSPSFSSVNTGVTTIDERDEFGSRTLPVPPKAPIQRAETPQSDATIPTPTVKKFKWFGGASKEKKKQQQRAHTFAQQTVMRVARCDHCGDKMWGAQLKCTGCNIACHPKCHTGVQSACQPNLQQQQQQQQQDQPMLMDIAPLPASLFGRDLVEQVRSDAKGSDRQVPVIVEKCIQAVEALAMDYEGIYRKTGGSSQSKAITQLFERGNYDAFDLRDTDAFNDICSVTSVLKTYFRSLPNPLLTYALHDAFVQAACIRDAREKHNGLLEQVSKLPTEHYQTLRVLMLHLNRIQQRCDENLMNARNLGVVFGPTLMRSDDPAKEFADMAGKALSIQWFVENAPEIFQEASR